MRSEKQFLVDEVSSHLGKSDYVFLTDYRKMTVPDLADLRGQLAKQGAEFHVIKNSILNVAAKSRNLPDLSSALKGQTAIVVGGKNPAEVAKVLLKFFKDKEKVEIKVGVVAGKALSNADCDALSKLPGLEVLRAQLLGLLNTPATQAVRVIQAVPQGLLNVLKAKSEQAA